MNNYITPVFDKDLIEDDLQLLQKLREIAKQTAKELKLKLSSVEHHRIATPDRPAGLCWRWQKKIDLTIRFRNNDTGAWRKERGKTDDILSTLAHELAHLKYANHRSKFCDYHFQIVRPLVFKKALESGMIEEIPFWVKGKTFILAN